jgi:hypothetical protein
MRWRWRMRRASLGWHRAWPWLWSHEQNTSQMRPRTAWEDPNWPLIESRGGPSTPKRHTPPPPPAGSRSACWWRRPLAAGRCVFDSPRSPLPASEERLLVQGGGRRVPVCLARAPRNPSYGFFETVENSFDRTYCRRQRSQVLLVRLFVTSFKRCSVTDAIDFVEVRPL